MKELKRPAQRLDVAYNFKIEIEALETIREHARKHKVSPSYLIREVLRQWCEEDNEKENP